MLLSLNGTNVWRSCPPLCIWIYIWYPIFTNIFGFSVSLFTEKDSKDTSIPARVVTKLEDLQAEGCTFEDALTIHPGDCVPIGYTPKPWRENGTSETKVEKMKSLVITYKFREELQRFFKLSEVKWWQDRIHEAQIYKCMMNLCFNYIKIIETLWIHLSFVISVKEK